MNPLPKTAVVSCMRNEGLFIVEWVAYHRVIGFDRILICSNDCTDGSDQLLDALSEAGIITHIRHNVREGDTPQDSGMRAAFAVLEQSDEEWLAHIDADEFINIGLGAGTIQDLLEHAGTGDVIALPWWAFGDSGYTHWPGEVLEHFTMAEDYPVKERAKFKSLFRLAKFAHANDHMPVAKEGVKIDVRSALGEPLTDDGVYGIKRAKYRPSERALCPQAACINHYAVPSRDVFLMKNDRGDGQGKISDKYHLGGRWHTVANRNDVPNTRIQRHLAATRQQMAMLRRLPFVADYEAACTKWFQARCAAILTPAQIALWKKPAKRISLE